MKYRHSRESGDDKQFLPCFGERLHYTVGDRLDNQFLFRIRHRTGILKKSGISLTFPVVQTIMQRIRSRGRSGTPRSPRTTAHFSQGEKP